MSGKKINVEKWDVSKDGEINVENMEKKLTAQGYSFIKYTFPPGIDFPDHKHARSKKDSILGGEFEFGMYGEKVVLKSGDMIEVPADTIHNAKVVGNTSVIFYDATKYN